MEKRNKITLLLIFIAVLLSLNFVNFLEATDWDYVVCDTLESAEERNDGTFGCYSEAIFMESKEDGQDFEDKVKEENKQIVWEKTK